MATPVTQNQALLVSSGGAISGALSSFATLAASMAEARAVRANVSTAAEQIKANYADALLKKRALEKKASQLFGQQESAYAASGVALGSGSALDVLAGSRAELSADVGTLWSNTERESRAVSDRMGLMIREQRLKNRVAAITSGSQLLTGYSQSYMDYGKITGRW